MPERELEAGADGVRRVEKDLPLERPCGLFDHRLGSGPGSRENDGLGRGRGIADSRYLGGVTQRLRHLLILAGGGVADAEND